MFSIYSTPPDDHHIVLPKVVSGCHKGRRVALFRNSFLRFVILALDVEHIRSTNKLFLCTFNTIIEQSCNHSDLYRLYTIQQSIYHNAGTQLEGRAERER
jgi:hypothetical protein